MRTTNMSVMIHAIITYNYGVDGYDRKMLKMAFGKKGLL